MSIITVPWNGALASLPAKEDAVHHINHTFVYCLNVKKTIYETNQTRS